MHNSPWLRAAEAGYYYPDFDIQAGAAQLLHALRSHDAQRVDYQARAALVFQAVDPCNPLNVDGYAQRLLALVGGDPGFRPDAPRVKS